MAFKLAAAASRGLADVGSMALSLEWSAPLLAVLIWRPALADNICGYIAKAFSTTARPGVITRMLSVRGTAATLLVFFVGRQANRILSTMAANSWGIKPREDWTWSEEIAVVTGGCSGIGEAITLRLAAMGVKVAVLDVQDLPVNMQASERIRYYRCDVSSASSVGEAAKTIRSELGHPSILVNNAGTLKSAPIMAVAEEDLRRVNGVNTLALWFTTQQFGQEMVRLNKGHIVTVASLASFVAASSSAPYAASKAAALAFHESLAGEIKHVYKTPGVLTTIVHPHWVRTPLVAERMDQFKDSGVDVLESDHVAKAVVDQIQSRRGAQLIMPSRMGFVTGMRGWPVWMQEILRDSVRRNTAFKDPAQ
ncbi:hypothetical protein N3K66_008540 [Trichothecium roseum]|uniref:Uncharacterized protein n=1 Tax=Trichothecium roseum TaxID=47278 RepID=A0ACC0UQI6_9HYPO|nr:hypothetical protein N3K66_008540 [Trichothecium roseum]